MFATTVNDKVFRPQRRVLLLPGWFGRAQLKASHLNFWGFDVHCPELNNFSFKKAVCQAQELHEEIAPDIIVGSSRGGAVAMSLETSSPLILLAPAWRFFIGDPTVKGNATVIHSPCDKTVLFADSLELARCNPGVKLIATGKEHTMNCSDSMNALKRAVYDFVES